MIGKMSGEMGSVPRKMGEMIVKMENMTK